ncbi:hypothetical protein MTO96_022663 [Rhipicephalus appendiculatus]
MGAVLGLIPYEKAHESSQASGRAGITWRKGARATVVRSRRVNSESQHPWSSLAVVTFESSLQRRRGPVQYEKPDGPAQGTVLLDPERIALLGPRGVGVAVGPDDKEERAGRLPLLLTAITGALAVREDSSFAFTGYGNVFGGGISAPGSSSYEPLQTAAAEPVPQKVAVQRPASSVTVLEKPSKLRLARPPAVTVLPNAAAPGGHVSLQAPGTSTVTTYPTGAHAVTFQRPLIYAAPPQLQYVAAAPQHVVFAQHGSAGVAAPPATATKTVVAAAAAPADPATAKAKTATATAGATVTSAGAAVVTSAKPTAVTVSRPVAVTYPPAQTYLFQRPAYAYPGAAAATAGVQAPVQVTYMRPLYHQTPYGLQPAGFAPVANHAYQRPLVAYQHGAAAAPLTVAYPGALRPLAAAPGVFAAPHVAMPLAAAAPLVSAVHGAAAAPVAAMPPYALARQVIAPFPGNVAVARPQLTYAQPAYGAPLSYGHGAALTYAPAAVQPTQVYRPAKSKK